MAKVQHPGADLIYRAAELFRSNALMQNGSLFTPGVAIWSPPIIADLRARFIGSPDDSTDSFKVKLGRQL